MSSHQDDDEPHSITLEGLQGLDGHAKAYSGVKHGYKYISGHDPQSAVRLCQEQAHTVPRRDVTQVEHLLRDKMGFRHWAATLLAAGLSTSF